MADNVVIGLLYLPFTPSWTFKVKPICGMEVHKALGVFKYPTKLLTVNILWDLTRVKYQNGFFPLKGSTTLQSIISSQS